MMPQVPVEKLSEMTLDELRLLNKEVGAEIAKLQTYKAEIVDAFSLKQSTQKDAEVLRKLTPARRAALLRALELQQVEDEKAAAAEAERLKELGELEPPEEEPEPEEPENPRKLTDAQRATLANIVRQAELAAVAADAAAAEKPPTTAPSNK